MFLVRLALAALSAGNWGIYGPAMELLEATPREPGSEEYLDSEKYEIKRWNLDAPESLAPFIRRLNELRRTEPALQRDRQPLVQELDDPHLLAWVRYDDVSANRVLVVVNMRPGEARSGPLRLDAADLGLEGRDAILAHDLLGDAVHAWHLEAVTVECTPERPVLVYRLVDEPGPEQPPA
jgi:starch synthase (maltosyl-transferring)